MDYHQPQVAWALTSARAAELGRALLEAANTAGRGGTVMLNNGMEPDDGALYIDVFGQNGFMENEWVAGIEVIEPRLT